jgi:hypothetical protein
MDDDRYQILAAAYLKQLAVADMKVWRQHNTGQEARDLPDQPLSHELAKQVGSMKRVMHLKGFGNAKG